MGGAEEVRQASRLRHHDPHLVGPTLAATGAHPDEVADGWRSQAHAFWAIENNAFDLDAFVAANRGRRWPDWLVPLRPRALTGRAAFTYAVDRITEQLVPSMLDMAGFWTAMAVTTGAPRE